MVEHFGGYSEYIGAPFHVAKAHEYVWQAKNQAIAEKQKRDNAQVDM